MWATAIGSAWLTADAAVFAREVRGAMTGGRAVRVTTTDVCRGLPVGTVGLLAFMDGPLEGGPGIRDVTRVAYERGGGSATSRSPGRPAAPPWVRVTATCPPDGRAAGQARQRHAAAASSRATQLLGHPDSTASEPAPAGLAPSTAARSYPIDLKQVPTDQVQHPTSRPATHSQRLSHQGRHPKPPQLTAHSGGGCSEVPPLS